ncbi:2,3-bisphosphoglycerate-independent phosphoglycerate mutase [Pseudomonas gingeri]|uniref:2,3-bisphosphoglycerate-independent phosphoglycerate mutase n=1 Tax=Pseudomonas gingeri TaxID=117681 RepID=UPI0015A3F0E3|nr:2,3-bisphosphoglycerate-independent phosphoglycerate mutase [Pseudomonas gingeri]NWA28179.1 2,3-bisphosphoglycerate-independent phosphoglycerate mutase [Pseudomonas gingeri]NWD66610.1 2,3-bisphosphoglycerate-independent phosphoglycerate mutase [Pseudomonas gingeri]
MTAKTLIILDGVGLRESTDANAFAAAKTPTIDRLLKEYPSSQIETSGIAVGLPDGQMGNSEVGHMNLGAGRIVYQSFTRINKAIDDGEFAGNPSLNHLIDATSQRGGALLIMGLVSSGGVHSHIDQIIALTDVLSMKTSCPVYIHAFLDGRDTPPKSAFSFISTLEAHIHVMRNVRIASVIGRYFALDRDNRWDRVEAAYNLIADGQAEYQFNTATTALMAAYDRGETDEFVKASSIGDTVGIAPEDSIIFMNFRPDRARQITSALTNNDFDKFARKQVIPAEQLLTLTRYSDDIPCPVMFEPQPLTNSLGEVLATQGRRQLRIAETEKYAHVTFFFNGGREAPFEGEERILIPSPPVASYDLQPEMSAIELTDRLVDAIDNGSFDLIVCNYANGDMVGHTGNFDAAVKAVETLDSCLERVVYATLKNGGECLITADHGNVEQMLDVQSGQAHTAHTVNPVPLIWVSNNIEGIRVDNGRLCDLAPTLLEMLGIKVPSEMSGRSLLVHI